MTSDPKREAFAQCVKDGRIKAIQETSPPYQLFATEEAAELLKRVGIKTDHKTQSYRHDHVLGNHARRIEWEGKHGLYAAFDNNLDAFMRAMHGVQLVPLKRRYETGFAAREIETSRTSWVR